MDNFKSSWENKIDNVITMMDENIYKLTSDRLLETNKAEIDVNDNNQSNNNFNSKVENKFIDNYPVISNFKNEQKKIDICIKKIKSLSDNFKRTNKVNDDISSQLLNHSELITQLTDKQKLDRQTLLRLNADHNLINDRLDNLNQSHSRRLQHNSNIAMSSNNNLDLKAIMNDLIPTIQKNLTSYINEQMTNIFKETIPTMTSIIQKQVISENYLLLSNFKSELDNIHLENERLKLKQLASDRVINKLKEQLMQFEDTNISQNYTCNSKIKYDISKSIDKKEKSFLLTIDNKINDNMTRYNNEIITIKDNIDRNNNKVDLLYQELLSQRNKLEEFKSNDNFVDLSPHSNSVKIDSNIIQLDGKLFELQKSIENQSIIVSNLLNANNIHQSEYRETIAMIIEAGKKTRCKVKEINNNITKIIDETFQKYVNNNSANDNSTNWNYQYTVAFKELENKLAVINNEVQSNSVYAKRNIEEFCNRIDKIDETIQQISKHWDSLPINVSNMSDDIISRDANFENIQNEIKIDVVRIIQSYCDYYNDSIIKLSDDMITFKNLLSASSIKNSDKPLLDSSNEIKLTESVTTTFNIGNDLSNHQELDSNLPNNNIVNNVMTYEITLDLDEGLSSPRDFSPTNLDNNNSNQFHTSKSENTINLSDKTEIDVLDEECKYLSLKKQLHRLRFINSLSK